MNDLLPHQQRVIQEKMDLDDKITQLQAFLVSTTTFPTLPNEEQQLLKLQLNAMRMYSTFLDARIDLFPLIKHDRTA